MIMGNREVNYPDILPQEQPPKHCPHHAMHVSKLMLTSTATSQGMTTIRENGSKLIQHISQTSLR